MARSDLIVFGLVLLGLNGVRFPPIRISTMAHITINSDEIIDLLLEEWDINYVQVIFRFN